MRRLISIGTFIHWTLLTVLLGGVGLYTTSAEDAAPYLYYFHPDVNAWVIERADGSDSRLLGQGISDQNPNAAEGSWSPSGKWFAWKSHVYLGGGGGNLKLQIIRTDGTQTVEMTDYVVPWFKWALTSDHLFFASGNPEIPEGYYLFEPSDERILWSLEIPQSYPSPILGQLIGDYFVYWDGTENGIEAIRKSIHMVSLITGEDIQLPTDTGRVSSYVEYVKAGMITQPVITIGTHDSRDVYELDVQSGKLTKRQPSSFKDLIVYQNTDGTYGLYLEKQPCTVIQDANTQSIDCNTLWLMSAGDGLKTKIASGVVSRYPPALWVQDSDIAFYVLENGDVYKLDADSKEIKLIASIKAKLPPHWITTDDQLIIHAATPDYTLHRVSISQGQYIDDLFIPGDDGRGGIFNFEGISLSPDERYIQLGDAQSLYDLTTDTFTPIIRHSAAAYAGRHSTYYEWSSGGGWLITGQVVFHSGGGGGPYANMVLRSDGTARRELSASYNQPKWLPEHVIPQLPPAQSDSVLPQPHLTLEHQGKVTGVSWNHNGTRLAVSVDTAQLYIWSFEEAEPQVEQVIQMDTGCGYFVYACRIKWSNDERFISLGMIPRYDDYQTTYYSLVDLESSMVIGSSDYPLEWDENGFSIRNLQYPSPRDDTATLRADYLERGEATGIVVVREIATQQYITEFPIEGKVVNLHWVDETRTLLVQTTCTLQKWDVKDGLIDIFQPSEYCNGLSYVASSDGGWAATESIYQPSKVFHFGVNQPPRSLNWYAKAVSFTPDNCWLTAAGTQLVTIWKLSDLISAAPISTHSCASFVSGTYKVQPS